MSKIADMKQTIEELRSAAAAINDAADWLYQQFSSTDNSDKQQTSKSAATKEEPKPELKLEDVRSVLAGKSRAGHTAEVRDLLQKCGATKLSAIDPKLFARSSAVFKKLPEMYTEMNRMQKEIEELKKQLNK
jgi:regulator of replication initiation timing